MVITRDKCYLCTDYHYVITMQEPRVQINARIPKKIYDLIVSHQNKQKLQFFGEALLDILTTNLEALRQHQEIHQLKESINQKTVEIPVVCTHLLAECAKKGRGIDPLKDCHKCIEKRLS